MPSRTFILAVAMLALWSVASAGGSPSATLAGGHPPGGYGQATLRLAERYWAGPPPNCASIVWTFDAPLPADRSGEATVPNRSGTACVAKVAPQPNVYALCLVVLHEYGHLMGNGHSADPRALMFGVPFSDAQPWQPEVWQCDAFSRSIKKTSVTKLHTRP